MAAGNITIQSQFGAPGTANVVHTARNMGVTTLDKADGSYGPSLTLGSYPVPLWEMAQAGTVFAEAEGLSL